MALKKRKLNEFDLSIRLRSKESESKPSALPKKKTQYVKSYSEGLAAVYYEDIDKFGFIDEDGKVVVEPRFDFVSEFYHGISIVSDGIRFNVIDKTGRFLESSEYEDIGDFEWGEMWETRDPEIEYRDYNFIFKDGAKIDLGTETNSYGGAHFERSTGYYGVMKKSSNVRG